jgi:hypothetical protein
MDGEIEVEKKTHHVAACKKRDKIRQNFKKV